MHPHITKLQTQIAANGAVRYRWRCSCGATGARWHKSGVDGKDAKAAADAARDGGERHEARGEV